MSGKYPKWFSAPILLGLFFIGLKLGGAISWSWWLVCLPLYIGWVIGLGLIAIYFLGLAAYAVFAIIIWTLAIIGAKVRGR